MIFELDIGTSEIIERIEDCFGLRYLFYVVAEDKEYPDPAKFADKCMELLKDAN